MRFLLLALLCAACGDSPLLNHETASKMSGAVTGAQGLVFPRSARAFTLEWQSGCPSFDECRFTVMLQNPLQEGEELEAQLWMPSMGHGSSPVKSRELGPLQWELSEVFFIMPGQWDVVLRIKHGGVVRDEIRLAYRL